MNHAFSESAVLLTTSRNGVIERVDRGHCVLADADGRVLWSAGNPDHVTYLRSSAKPFQATALLMSGASERFELGTEHVAIACGSHSGEPGHIRAALSLLERAGVPPQALQCGAHELSFSESSSLARMGLAPTPLHNNCSGKHSGMLAAAQALHAPLATYLDAEHPVQRLILANLARCAGLPIEAVQRGIDGCNAPNFALPMRSIARCYARLAMPLALEQPLGAALMRIGAAMSEHPWLVHGTGGLDTALMANASVSVRSKGGAEGLQCVALPTLGLGLAVKVESGRADRIGSIVIAILRALGILEARLSDALGAFDEPPVINHRGIRVGETTVVLDTQPLRHLASSSSLPRMQ